MITYRSYNDKKEKYQSFESNLYITTESSSMSYVGDVIFTGYGADKTEADINLYSSVNKFLKDINAHLESVEKMYSQNNK